LILQLDVGNTRLKWRLHDGQALRESGSQERSAHLQLPELSVAPAAVWVASVAGAEYNEQLSQRVQAAWGVSPWFAQSRAQACGVTNSYAEPERMGVDRWLAMIAAWTSVQAPVCVIDAGSALTIDLVTANGAHRGGYILPGLKLMERALLSDTDGVRFGEAPRDQLSPGRSTEAAVLNGLALSQVGAVATALARFGDSEVLVFCGGDGAVLQRLLDAGGDYRADLVLDGLGLLAAAEFASAEPGV